MAINPQARRGAMTEKLKIFLILVASFLTLIAAGTVSVGYGVHRYWENTLRQEIARNLTQKAQMFASRLNIDREHKIADITAQEGHDAGARATVIDSSGKVIADSQFPVSFLENEGRRPEIVTASRGQVAMETRKRNDFGVPILYVAVPFAGGVARLAYPLADIEIAATRDRHVMLIGSVVASLAALAISWLAAGTVLRS